MSKQTKNGKCSCFNEVNKKLKEHDTELDIDFTISNPSHYYLNVGVYRPDGNYRKKVKRIFASFCPFCGAKLKEQDG